MSKTIWKFSLSVADWCEVPAPSGAKVLHIATQDGVPCVWMEVDINAPRAEIKRFRTYGTGHRMDDADQTYLGTYIVADGALVFHVYEQKADR